MLLFDTIRSATWLTALERMHSYLLSWKRRAFWVIPLVDALAMSRRGGQKARAWPSMLQLPARWLLLMCGWWHPAKTMQLRGSMASMMRVSKAQIIFSALWCSRRLELSTQRERRCSNSCFDSQQSGLVGSLHLTAAALGLACLATCRDQFLNQFLLAFVKRKCGVGVSVGVCSA